jgi:hypothetical protein
MDKQAWEHEHDPDGRIQYVAAFLPVAWGGTNTMFTEPACHIESFCVDGEAAVHVTTVLNYRGQQCQYRRQIWPAAHPALLAAQLYITSLEEELNTSTVFHSSPGEMIDLLKRPDRQQSVPLTVRVETGGQCERGLTRRERHPSGDASSLRTEADQQRVRGGPGCSHA